MDNVWKTKHFNSCCGLNWLMAEHHTVLCSLPPSQWDGGKNKKKPHKVELMSWDKSVYKDRGKGNDNNYGKYMNIKMYITVMHKQLLTIPWPMSISPSKQWKGEVNFHPLQNFFHLMSYGTEFSLVQWKSAFLILFLLRCLGLSLWTALALYSTA